MENKLHQEQEKVHLAEEKDSKAKRERDALEKSRAKVVKFESALVELGAGTCSFPVTGSRSSCATAAGYPGTDVFSLTALLCLTWQRVTGSCPCSAPCLRTRRTCSSARTRGLRSRTHEGH